MRPNQTRYTTYDSISFSFQIDRLTRSVHQKNSRAHFIHRMKEKKIQLFLNYIFFIIECELLDGFVSFHSGADF